MRKLIFDPRAREDLISLSDWIAEHSSDARALGYVRRIEAYCYRLCDFPFRGTVHDDLGAGVRTVGFERRVTIAFTVTDEAVVILRLLYGGRSLERVFEDEED